METQIVLSPMPMKGLKNIAEIMGENEETIKWAAEQDGSPIIVTGEESHKRYRTEYNRLFEWLKNNIHLYPDKNLCTK